MEHMAEEYSDRLLRVVYQDVHPDDSKTPNNDDKNGYSEEQISENIFKNINKFFVVCQNSSNPKFNLRVVD